MSKKVAVDAEIEQAMARLGAFIYQCRGTNSLRAIAKPSGIPASQLLAIENGTMAPTADVYPRLLNALRPNEEQRTEMDKLFMTIRKIPPPDICKTIITNQALIDAMRAVDGVVLTGEQLNMVKILFASFAAEETKGEMKHGQNL